MPSNLPTSASAPQPPVLVLGAGLMGRLVALTLRRQGHAVRLVDAGAADASGSAARVAAAMLAPLAESAITEAPVVAMGLHSLPRWPQIIDTLRRPVFFQQRGTLIVWHRQDAPEAERLRAQMAHNTRTLSGLPTPQSLDASALQALEPALEGRFRQALYLPQEGQLDNRDLLDALLDALRHEGVTLQWNHPMDWATAQDTPEAREGWLIDCRGLGAQAQWPALRGVRGEVVRLHAPGVNLTRPTRLLHPRYPIYIAPKAGDVYVIGATEIESNDRSPASVRSTLELLSAAYAVHPGFGEARILEISTQCRPTLPDNLPALRVLGPRALQVNGLYRHGFLIAPAVLDAVVQWVQGGRRALADRLGLCITQEATACA